MIICKETKEDLLTMIDNYLEINQDNFTNDRNEAELKQFREMLENSIVANILNIEIHYCP